MNGIAKNTPSMTHPYVAHCLSNDLNILGNKKEMTNIKVIYGTRVRYILNFQSLQIQRLELFNSSLRPQNTGTPVGLA